MSRLYEIKEHLQGETAALCVEDAMLGEGFDEGSRKVQNWQLDGTR